MQVISNNDGNGQKVYSTEDMCRCFNAWDDTKLLSKKDQLIWVAAEDRFALLSRDKIDFKIAKSWNFVFHYGSELLVKSSRAIADILYKPENELDVYKDINRMVDIFKSQIGKKSGLSDECAIKYKDKLSRFKEGLKTIKLGYESSSKVDETIAINGSIKKIKSLINEIHSKSRALVFFGEVPSKEVIVPSPFGQKHYSESSESSESDQDFYDNFKISFIPESNIQAEPKSTNQTDTLSIKIYEDSKESAEFQSIESSEDVDLKDREDYSGDYYYHQSSDEENLEGTCIIS